MSNPLILHHEKLGAQLDPANSPLSYADPLEEYWAIKKAAGLIDISYMGRLKVTGKDRIAFLNSLLTNDITHLPENGGQHSALLTTKARIIADLYLYNMPDAILIDAGDSPAVVVKNSLDQYIITEVVQIHDATQDLVHMTIQGPKAGEAIKETLGVGVDDLKPLQRKILGPSIIISRDRTGQGGFDIIVPSVEAEPVWQGFLLKAADVGLRPVGVKALDVLRLEAGYPKYGLDVDQNTIILEAGFKDAMSFTKGCYLGQEVVARATHIGRVNKQLVRLEIDARQPPPGRSKLSSNGVDAGFLTSASYSPGLDRVAGLAYANRDFAKVGTRLTVESGHGQLSAMVTGLV